MVFLFCVLNHIPVFSPLIEDESVSMPLTEYASYKMLASLWYALKLTEFGEKQQLHT